MSLICFSTWKFHLNCPNTWFSCWRWTTQLSKSHVHFLKKLSELLLTSAVKTSHLLIAAFFCFFHIFSIKEIQCFWRNRNSFKDIRCGPSSLKVLEGNPLSLKVLEHPRRINPVRLGKSLNQNLLVNIWYLSFRALPQSSNRLTMFSSVSPKLQITETTFLSQPLLFVLFWQELVD